MKAERDRESDLDEDVVSRGAHHKAKPTPPLPQTIVDRVLALLRTGGQSTTEIVAAVAPPNAITDNVSPRTIAKWLLDHPELVDHDGSGWIARRVWSGAAACVGQGGSVALPAVAPPLPATDAQVDAMLRLERAIELADAQIDELVAKADRQRAELAHRDSVIASLRKDAPAAIAAPRAHPWQSAQGAAAAEAAKQRDDRHACELGELRDLLTQRDRRIIELQRQLANAQQAAPVAAPSMPQAQPFLGPDELDREICRALEDLEEIALVDLAELLGMPIAACVASLGRIPGIRRRSVKRNATLVSLP